MRYQMESATFDHARVIIRETANPTTNFRVLWEWKGATMTVAPGSPVTNIGESAGWGIYNADITDFQGLAVDIVFHVDTDTSINFGGLAIDDVVVRSTTTVAANVNVSGRVATEKGNGIPNTRVTLTDSNGTARTAITNSFGYYSFDQVGVGGAYVLSANHRAYQFDDRIIFVNDEVTDADIVGIE